MFRLFTLLLTISITLNASWIDDFNNGRYVIKPHCLYEYVVIPANGGDFRQKAKDQGLQGLAKQLYSVVKSETASDMLLIDDSLKDAFSQSLMVVTDIPVHGQQLIKEQLRGGKYYLLFELDKNDARPVYETRAKALADETDKAVKDARSSRARSDKLRRLRHAKTTFAEYGKHAMVASLMGAKKVRPPKYGAYEIDNMIAQLERQPAENVTELAALLVNRLDPHALDATITVAPFGFAATETFSDFSSELQNALLAAFSRQKIRVNQNGAPVKAVGSYYLKPKNLRVNLQLQDKKGSILTVSEASMRIRNQAAYRPKKNDYPALRQTVQSGKLTVSGRINGKSKNLLLKEGEKLDIQFKVSRAAYVYIVANMRTQNGRQVQYLLRMSDEEGDAQFRRYVPAHQAGLWISIAPEENPFYVVPPFGTEHFQIFASSKDILSDMPRLADQRIDAQPYIGVITDTDGSILDAGRAAAKTRGVQQGVQKRDKQFAMSEYLLSFTTVEQ